jgi:hypothetical protein
MLCTRTFLVSVAAICCAVFEPGVLSAQNSGIGSDGYTRLLWKGSDSSIIIWKLDSSLYYFDSVTYGPYFSWVPQAIAVGPDNYTRILWKNPNGSIIIWLVDPYLNFYSSRIYGPFTGWCADSISVDPFYNTSSLTWSATNGEVAIWSLDANLDFITSRAYGPLTAYDPLVGTSSKHLHPSADTSHKTVGSDNSDSAQARAAAAMKIAGNAAPMPGRSVSGQK